MCLSDPENFFQFLSNNYKIINMVINYPIVQWILLFCFYVFIQSIVLFGVNFIKNIFLYFLSIEFLLKSNQKPITILEKKHTNKNTEVLKKFLHGLIVLLFIFISIKMLVTQGFCWDALVMVNIEPQMGSIATGSDPPDPNEKKKLPIKSHYIDMELRVIYQLINEILLSDFFHNELVKWNKSFLHKTSNIGLFHYHENTNTNLPLYEFLRNWNLNNLNVDFQQNSNHYLF
jgi:hypothetical protein